MRKNLTEIVFILDESGSMFGLKGDTIGGFNSLIAKQKAEKGEAVVSTVLFNSHSRVLYDRVPLERIEKMTDKDYCPEGNTALLDAVGEAVHHIGNVHKYARSEDVPRRTVFIINTDGMENASRNYTVSKVKKMISRQQETYGWEFVFLGANIDAAETAESIGIKRENAVDCCADGYGCAVSYETMSAAVSGVRRGAKLCESAEWRRGADEDRRRRGR